jgi:hypothetical protein
LWAILAAPQLGQVFICGTAPFHWERRVHWSELPRRFLGTGMDLNLYVNCRLTVSVVFQKNGPLATGNTTLNDKTPYFKG